MSRCRSKTRVRSPLKRHEFLSAHWFTHPNLAPEDHIISKSRFSAARPLSGPDWRTLGWPQRYRVSMLEQSAATGRVRVLVASPVLVT